MPRRTRNETSGDTYYCVSTIHKWPTLLARAVLPGRLRIRPYDEPPIKAIKLVPYSDSEDEGGSPKKTIGTDDDPPQLMDYSAQPTTSNDKPSMTREWGLTDEQCISWEHELQQALDTIPSSLESWFDNMLNDLPDELEEIGKDSAYSSRATSAHKRTTQRTGLGAHKKTIRMDDPPDDIHPYSDSEDDAPRPSDTRKSTYSSSYDEPLSKTIKLVPYSDSEDDGGSPKKTIGIYDSPPQLIDYSDSEDGVPPSPNRL